MKTLSMIATALLFMGISTLATGQETTKSTATTSEKAQVTQQATTSVQQPYFVDKDNNGVCDNYENGNLRMGQRTGKGQGLGRCRGTGFGRGQGRMNGQGRGGNGNYVDADKDGICDKQQDGKTQQKLRDGSGRTNLPKTQNK